MLLERQDEALTPTGRGDVAAPPGTGETKPTGSTRRLMRRLSGRRRWVVGVGLLGALVGGVLGYFVWGQRTYEARGFVQLGRAAAAGPAGVTVLADRGDAVRFDEVVQRELEALRRLGGPAGQPDALDVVAAADPDAETRLTLRVRANEPTTAAEALRAILASYTAKTELSGDAERATYYQSQWDTLLKLRSDAARAQAQLAEARASDNPPGSEDAVDLEAAWSAANAALLSAERDDEAARRRVEGLRAMDPPTTSEVAALDPEAAKWYGRQRALDQQLSVTAWPPAPAAAQRLRERAELESRLRERAADTRVLPVGQDSLVFRDVRLSEAQAEADSAAARLSQARSAVQQLQPAVTRRSQLEAEARRLTATVATAEAQLAALDPGPGLRLVGSGFAPDTAEPTAAVTSDTRPIWTSLGAFGGALLGGVGTVLLFLTDRRVRRRADGALVDSALPLISAVPVVGAGDTQPGDTLARQHGGPSAEVSSIQSVRAVLEAQMARGQVSFGVAGVGPGSGTTSIAAGLAVSMAVSGSRVLLIDLAWLQKPAGTGTDDEATREGLGIDGVIEELGYLEDEDSEIIALGGDAGVGFGALLEGASLRRSVVQTRLPGLAILSAMGQAEALRRRWAGRLSSRWLSKLLTVSRSGGYAATILDTGSATGSVEGMLGCAAADGTIVVVSQHETQAEYDKAVSRLSLIGATPVGTVLNRSGATRRGETRGRVARAQATGGTTGSGIFAAAIEARAGDHGAAGATGGSGLVTAPLPTFDETPPSTIAPGVDPVDEPPATAQPTPPRTPPTPSTALPPAAAGSPDPFGEDSADDQAVVPEDPPVPQVHVIDDVMDQIVDHAIRSARRPRSGPPPAAPPKAAPPENASQDEP
ncbi:MAG: hypothetical protein AAF333_08550 [Planctomycetota bacterium]